MFTDIDIRAAVALINSGLITIENIINPEFKAAVEAVLIT